MFNPSTKAMLDLANSLKALKAFKGLLSFPDPLGLEPEGPPAPRAKALGPRGPLTGR
jgi:hypothetical protein